MLKSINDRTIIVLFLLKTSANIIRYSFVLLLLGACASQKYTRLNKEISKVVNQDIYDNHFQGVMIYNPETKDTLYRQNSNKYFTPASNTKIFTLYAAMKLLPDRIPTLKYVINKDTLFVEGTGDPTVLHPYFRDSTAVNYIKGFRNISLYLKNFHDNKFGPGWAWEDYDQYFSPERSGLPLYGNVVQVYTNNSIQISPAYFRDSVQTMPSISQRKTDRNIFYFNPSRKDSVEIPFKGSDSLTINLLETVIGNKISLISKMPLKEKLVLYGVASDTVYKQMMYESDNFLAEQLLILASSTLSDSLNSKTVRDFVLKNSLAGLQQQPRWVDGSGLSRYNLFSPESLVHVLQKLYNEVPKERLFQIFPTAGHNGTLKDWYGTNPTPFIYAKSGSLGNNYCLSGYLITKSGQLLIFSFMNNHFRQGDEVVKKNISEVLKIVRDSY